MTSLYLVHLLTTWYMVGIIWMVQLVHYSLFKEIGEAEFVRYEDQHQMRMGPVVAPMMLIEGGTAAVMLWGLTPLPHWLVIINVCLLAIIWASTAFVQVPLHARLSQGRNLPLVRQLLVTNWLRTALWTIRGFLLAYYVPVVG